MAIPKLFTLARMTTATSGTGTITLGAAATVNGVTYLSFSAAGVADGDVVAYGIADTNNSEYGYGTYTAAGTTLTRNVVRSTNSNNAISLSGSAQVFIVAGNAELLWGFDSLRNMSLAASVAANALTITLNDAYGATPAANAPVLAAFRSSTAATGTPVYQAARAATTLVLDSGVAAGTPGSSVPFRLWIVAFDNAGTIALGAICCLVGGSTPTQIVALNEGAVASSTAQAGTAAGTAGTFYTTSAVTSKAYRIIGYMDWSSGLATAGTWASGPTTIQLFGPGIKKPGDHIQTVVMSDTTETLAGSTTKVQTTTTVTVTRTSSPNVVRVTCSGEVKSDSTSLQAFAQLSRGTSPTLIGSSAQIFSTGAPTYGPCAFFAPLDNPASSTLAVSYYVFLWGAGTAANNFHWLPSAAGTSTAYIEAIEIMV